MKERTRKIFIMIVMAALIVSLMAASFAALTYGRYSGGRRDENSAYDDILDLVGETAFEVSTADELVNAINNGYSYIKVVGDDPTLVVNNDVADVIVNLVLDVNGHKIVRNSRNPLLNVRQSVSVVLVYDSSEKAEGGFYNPVGSALQTSGGTLTVGEGVYESGPSSEATQSQGEGTVSATVCSRDNNRKATSYSVQSTGQIFPKLTKKTGDVYLGETYSGTGDYLKRDTYLIYTEEENAFVEDGTSAGDGTVLDKEQLYVNAKKDDNGTVTSAEAFSPICNVASCDFYYYYPVGEVGTADSPQTYAVVYGYNDVKTLAETKDTTLTSADNEPNLVWPYAAIRSEAGNTHARGGEFYTYFGEENTYSIYSEGGTMTVGLSGESDPPKFQAIGKGVCINMAGTSGNADQTLTIENGEFSSKIGDTIKMSGGEMEVKKGSFTKDATGADENSTNNGSAISISGGTLNMVGTETDTISFTVTGDYVNGIKMEKAENDATANIADTIENAAFSFNNNGFGNSVAAIQVIGGTLNVSDSTFDFNGGSAETETPSANNGIYVQGGSVVAEKCTFSLSPDGSVTGSAAIASAGGTVTATDCAFTIPGNNNYGIYSSITEEGAGEGEYDTTATDCTFTMTGNQNHGIYAAGGKTLASGGTYTIGSENGSGQTANFGIQVSSGSVALAGVTLDVYGEKSSCVYAVGGTISLSGNNAVNMHFSSDKTTISSTAISTEGGAIEVTGGSTSVSSDALGITARQNDGNEGSISIANGAAVTVGSNGSPLQVTGVYVNGGKIENKGTLTVFSTIEDRFSWNENNKYNGVFVNGGSLVSNGTLNVTFTGVQNEENGDYLTQQIKSYAVRVEGDADTTVTIASGNILNGSYDENGNVKENSGVGGGVYVGGGTVTLGVKNGNKGPTVQTTGKLLYTSWLEVVGGSWKYMLNKSGGHAVEVSGGSLTVHGGNYTSQQGNGILIRNTADVKTTNTVTIEDGSFVGYNSGYYIEYDGQTPLGGDRMVGPAASYGLNVMGHDLDVRINGGEFGNNEGDVGNSAASFFGTPDGSRPQVAVHGGTFNANNADAISVFRFIDITFDGTASKISSNISNGAVASLSVQNDLLYTGESDRGSTIEIQSGTFTGTAYGIWYACGYDKLSISGDATIKGPTGLQVASAPVENGITISGGTIEGGTEGIYYNASASVSGEGYGLNITGGIIRGTGNNKNGHALNIVVEPKKHAIHIGGEAQLFGGRDAIYVNNAGGEEDAVCVSITGGTFTGAEQDTTAGDYGCAIWFDSGMNSSVYQITGGTFITKEGGSAIWTSSPVTHYLWQIFPDGCSITDGEGNSFNRNWNFNTTIKGKSQITVSMS